MDFLLPVVWIVGLYWIFRIWIDWFSGNGRWLFSGIWIRTFGFGFGCLSSGLDSVGFQDLDAWIS
jgi:hypothetical protein